MKQREEAYRMAIDAAQAELAELNAKLAEMEPLMRRKAMIENFLQNASVLRNAAAHGAPQPGGTGRVEVAEVKLVPGKGMSIWEGARDVLAAAKHPMTVPWIVDAMRASGWKFEAKWTNEIVRGAMQRKLDVFEVASKGFYALKEWPSEMKKVSRDFEVKARHNIHPAATIQHAPDDEDLETLAGVKKR